MDKTALILAVLIAVPNAPTYKQSAGGPNGVSDLLPICEAYGESQVVFLGRAEAPITIRISAEAEIENARQELIKIQHQVAQLRASLDLRTRLERDLELQELLEEALTEFGDREAMYSAYDGDYTFIPIIVEQSLRGATESTLMLRLLDRSLSLKPGELYVIGGRLSREQIPPIPELASRFPFAEYVEALRATRVGAATRDLRFLAASARGATIVGDLRRHSYGAVAAPLAGVRILVSSDTQSLDAVTQEDGTFIVSGIDAGPVVVTPLLSRDLAVVNKSSLTFSFRESWCKPLSLTVELNGQIRGRILGAHGQSLDTVELVLRTVHGDDFTLVSTDSIRMSARPSRDGTFEFSGVPPGSYLLTAVLQRTEDGKTHYSVTYFPGTSDVAAAVPIVVGKATQHDGIDFLVTD